MIIVLASRIWTLVIYIYYISTVSAFQQHLQFTLVFLPVILLYQNLRVWIRIDS